MDFFSMAPKVVKNELKIGDRVVVSGMSQTVTVESITKELGDRVKIGLDWGEHGKSHVMLHDEGSVWFRYSKAN